MKPILFRIKQRLDLKKPKAATLEEWDAWEDEARKTQPVAFFLTETLPHRASKIKNALLRPFRSVRSRVRYNLTDRYHVINTGLAAEYHDVNTRMLHGMFSLLVDFVEVEQAWMEHCFGTRDNTIRIPWYMSGPFKIRKFRQPELGLRYVRWQMSLASPTLALHDQSPSQAHMAKEVYVLYHWWKHVRPARPDPTDLVNQWSAAGKEDQESLTYSQVERLYDKEDDEMCMRLVAIRMSLWT